MVTYTALWPRADVCAAKREARQLAWWRSPPRPRREREAETPEIPEGETPVAQEALGGEAGVEMEE